MSDRVTFDLAPAEVFADVETRTIRGLAVPVNQVARKGGKAYRFLAGSVEFGAHTPLLHGHAASDPLGRLTNHQWSDRGLECTFKVSKTRRGDEMLALADDGVLGLSVGVDFASDGVRQVADEYHVSKAFAGEVSLTALPAFTNSRVDSVTLQKDFEGATVPDNTVTTPAAATNVSVSVDSQLIADAIIGSLQAAGALDTGPQAQPVPTATAHVREELPYRFDGVRGKHGFVSDMFDSVVNRDGEAAARLDKFLTEVFVVQSNVSTLNPTRQRPDMYVEPLRYADSPIASAISTGTIADSTPFIFPRFGSSGTLVAPHVEGVEPSLATFTATSQTVTPGALSGKAELTREVWDAKGNPAVDQLVWAEMLNAWVEAATTRVATMLDAATPGGTIPVVGVDDSAVDDLVAALIALQYERGGSRFNSIVAASNLYTALASAKDSTGRRLLPQVGPQNADGTANSGWSALQLGAATAVPAWGLGTASYLFPRSSVWQWISVPQKMTFDIQVKSVFVGLFGYSAEAITRAADVRKITYAAA